MIDRRSFLKTAASVSVAAVAGVRGEAETYIPAPDDAPARQDITGRPNVLIFLPDQQRGGTVLPGSPVIKPHMDRFLQQAVAFNSAHCPAAHCCPSRTSFMSGLYPSEHGVYNNVGNASAIHLNPYPGTPFWGQWLRSAGYGTGYAGKLHVGRNVTPETCGFDNLSDIEQLTARHGPSKKKENEWEKARAEDEDPKDRVAGEMLRPDWGNLELYKTLPEQGAQSFDNLADTRIVRMGIAGMKKFAASNQPWCVMISNSGAHDPYDVPKQFVDMYDVDRIELPASYSDMMDDKPRIYQRQRYQYWSQLSEQETRDALRHYYAKCTMQDALFGEMLQALDETGQADNTVVIYVSDHGDYSAAHGLWMKGVASFREAYHIPAVVRWPKGIHGPGREVDALVDQVDWASTILEICGVEPQKKLSGASLVPWLKGESPADWRSATCTQMNGVELYYTQRIVMTKEWKYVYNGFDYDELYDLRNDPHEMRNLAFPDLAAKRSQVQAGHGLQAGGPVPWPPLPTELARVREDLLARMWKFAAEHKDIIFTPYGTVALAPFGAGAGVAPGSPLG